jgi:UDP-glucose 4-epimerase
VVDDLSTGILGQVNKQAEFVELSILDEKLLKLFEQQQFDAVIHLAAQTIVASSLQHPDVDARMNVLGTIKVLEGCRHTGVGLIVFASSAAVYGNVSVLPVAEDADSQPASFYGLSKLTAERYIQLYHDLYGLNYFILRYANVYGERQGDRGEGGVVSIFARGMSEGVPLTIYGDGEQTRDFVYVGDVAAANLAALSSINTNLILNISTQTETSVNRMAALLKEVSGYQGRIEYGPARSGDILRSMLSNRQACASLDWMPKISLQEGLARTSGSL